MTSSSDVNAFLYSDEENGVIIDADKSEDYYIIKDPHKQNLISFESIGWKDLQLEKIMLIHKSIRKSLDKVDISLPIYLQNCSDEIIEKHTPHQFSDHVVLYNFTLIDLFLKGILNQEAKKTFENCENGIRRFMIFLTFNHNNSIEKKLLTMKSSIETEVAAKIEINNTAIRSKRFNFTEKTKSIISFYQYKYNDICVGEMRVITSPNYILGKFGANMHDGVKFFLKMNLYTNHSAEFSTLKQKVIPRIIPIQIVSVNKETYESMHLLPGFNDIFIQISTQDEKESLKTNCNLLIGIIPSDQCQMIDFPVFSSSDKIGISLIVTYLGRARVIKEEKKIDIGKIRTDYSRSAINEYMTLITNLIHCKLTKKHDVEEFIYTSENPDLISSLSFKTMYKPNNMEEMYPILTQLRISDFKYYSDHDIAQIINKKRYGLQTIIAPSDGSELFISSGIIGFLNDKIKCNGKIWIDCFWWLNDYICKTLFDRWQIALSELSNEARHSAVDFFFNRDLYIQPAGMEKTVFNDIRSRVLQQFTQKNIMKRYIQLKVFHDILENSSTEIIQKHQYDIFSYASKLCANYDEQISKNVELNTMYQTMLYQYDLNKSIKNICSNAISLVSSSNKIPINIVFTNFSIEIDIDQLKQALYDDEDVPIEKRFVPPEIERYIVYALDMISIFKKNNYYVTTFESQNVSEIPRPYISSSSPCSSSSSPDDLNDMVEEELAAQLPKKTVEIKIISVKNLSELF